MGYGLIFAVVLVYLLMVINFQSWLDPLIILMALPGALAGILWMLFVTGTTISVPALMGAIMSIGVATANSILMVTFANDQRKDRGMNAHDAALAAGLTRLRPVIMTALAMIIGMLPMSLGLGEGGEQNAPLGRAVIGGLSWRRSRRCSSCPSSTACCAGRRRRRRSKRSCDNGKSQSNESTQRQRSQPPPAINNERDSQRKQKQQHDTHGRFPKICPRFRTVLSRRGSGDCRRFHRAVSARLDSQSSKARKAESNPNRTTTQSPSEVCEENTSTKRSMSSFPLMCGRIRRLQFFRASGYLNKLLVDIGDHVQAGQLLAEISVPDLDAQLDQAKADRRSRRRQSRQSAE